MRAAALLAAAFALAAAGRAEAKARYMDLPEAVAASDVVAVIAVERSEQVARGPGVALPKKGYWSYGQKNRFRFVEFVKRAPFVDAAKAAPQVLWAEKDFICASEKVAPGQYLVFLTSVEPGEWISVNHESGVVAIDGGRLSWPYDLRTKDPRTLEWAKNAVRQVKASGAKVRFEAEIVGEFFGLYNRWLPSRSHQVLVFHLAGRAPLRWPAGTLFARAVIPREVADQHRYESWVKSDGKLALAGEWVDGSLVIRSAQPVTR